MMVLDGPIPTANVLISGMRALVKGLKKNMPYIAENLPDLPQLAFKTLHKIANDELQIEWKSKEFESLKKEIREANQRNVRAMMGGSLVISGSLIVSLDGLAPIMVGSGQFLTPLLSWIFFIPGLYLLISSQWQDK